jgi:hypothetical protein
VNTVPDELENGRSGESDAKTPETSGGGYKINPPYIGLLNWAQCYKTFYAQVLQCYKSRTLQRVEYLKDALLR